MRNYAFTGGKPTADVQGRILEQRAERGASKSRAQEGAGRLGGEGSGREHVAGPVQTRAGESSPQAQPEASKSGTGDTLPLTVRKATTRESLYDDNPVAVQRFERVGIEHLVGRVSNWHYVGTHREGMAYGWVLPVGNAVAMAGRPSAKMMAYTLSHEMGHVADMVSHGGVYSAHPDMAFSQDGDGTIAASGAVPTELRDLVDGGTRQCPAIC